MTVCIGDGKAYTVENGEHTAELDYEEMELGVMVSNFVSHHPGHGAYLASAFLSTLKGRRVFGLVDPENKGAFEFYTKMGFKLTYLYMEKI